MIFQKYKNIGFAILALIALLTWNKLVTSVIPLLDTTVYIDIFYICLFGPFWEELFFRWAPITIAKNLGEKYILPLVIMFSCFFGYMHGYSHYGVLLQGILGLMLSFLYLRTSSFILIFLVHAIYNSILYF